MCRIRLLQVEKQHHTDMFECQQRQQIPLIFTQQEFMLHHILDNLFKIFLHFVCFIQMFPICSFELIESEIVLFHIIHIFFSCCCCCCCCGFTNQINNRG